MPSRVSEDWVQYRLGDLFEARNEPGFSGLPIMSVTMSDGLVPRDSLERRVESDLEPESHLLVREGDFVYNTMRMWQGVSGVAERDCLVSPAYVVCTPTQRLSPAFCRCLFQAPWMIKILESHSQGLTSDRLRLYFHHFAKLAVALPPLSEQRKIATILSSVGDAIAATRQVIEQTRRVKEGLIQELLTRGIGPDGRPHARFQQTEFGEIPASWEVRRLADLAPSDGMVGGPFGSDLTAEDYVEAPGVPVIRGGNISPGQFHGDNFVFVSAEKARSLRRNTAAPGDLVMTQRGASLGDAALVPADIEYRTFVVSQTIMRMRPDERRIRRRFLSEYVNSQAGRNWLSRQQTATGQPHLNLGAFRRMPAPVPPLQEQQALEERFEGIQAAAMANSVSLASMLQLRAGLLQDLLAGRIRVTV